MNPAYQEPRGPVFAFDQENKRGEDILAGVSFTASEMVTHILDLERISNEQPANLYEFHFFDTDGRRLELAGEDDLTVVAGDQKDYREDTRKKVRAAFDAIKSDFAGDPDFDSWIELVNANVHFVVFAEELAKALQEPALVGASSRAESQPGEIVFEAAARSSRPSNVWQAAGFKHRRRQ